MSNPSLLPERSVEFLRWWHDTGRELPIDPDTVELAFEAGRLAAEAADGREKAEREEAANIAWDRQRYEP